MATTYLPGKVAAATPAVALVSNSDGMIVPMGLGVLLKADGANSGTIYIGFNAAGNADGSTKGFPLAASELYLVTPDKCGGDARNIFVYGTGGIWHDLSVTVTKLPNS